MSRCMRCKHGQCTELFLHPVVIFNALWILHFARCGSSWDVLEGNALSVLNILVKVQYWTFLLAYVYTYSKCLSWWSSSYNFFQGSHQKSWGAPWRQVWAWMRANKVKSEKDTVLLSQKTAVQVLDVQLVLDVLVLSLKEWVQSLRALLALQLSLDSPTATVAGGRGFWPA